MLATAFYKLLLVLQYESANPGQDNDTRIKANSTAVAEIV